MNKAGDERHKFILAEMMDYADSITAERAIHGWAREKAAEDTGGSFSFYDLGESLLIGGCLNKSAGPENIREYSWFM